MMASMGFTIGNHVIISVTITHLLMLTFEAERPLSIAHRALTDRMCILVEFVVLDRHNHIHSNSETIETKATVWSLPNAFLSSQFWRGIHFGLHPFADNISPVISVASAIRCWIWEKWSRRDRLRAIICPEIEVNRDDQIDVPIPGDFPSVPQRTQCCSIK